MAGREIIQIHIGQAGVQLANACWELYCLEHAVKFDGTLYDPNQAEDSYSPFFALTGAGQVVPRVLMIDLEPTVIDEIRTGCYRKLFHPERLLTSKEDASNNFAKGMYGVGHEMVDLAMDRVRKLVEECGNMQGFLIFRAYGGGTGGGFGSMFLRNLENYFCKSSILEFVVFPSPKLSNIIVEPYNTVLSTHASTEYQDIAFILDNEAIYDILSTKLGNPRPMYSNVNRVIGQVVSNVTASLRFEGALNVDLSEYQTNLVPYRRIHYPIVAYAPFMPSKRLFHEQFSVASLTNSCFKPSHQLVKCDSDQGKYVSCCLLYRGDVVPVDVNNAVVNIKHTKNVQFVDWCPTGFKVGINYMPPIAVPGGDLARVTRAVTTLSNSTAIKFYWLKILKKYNVMLRKRAFVHHYVSEGMEEGEFLEAKENLRALILDYKEMES
ncbi:unnamed protein product [Phyllotreta striolata]|uniref:Tubulin alpha chain n=1 Tax=Phyllotreta striolata TaxID=444603 RepID=A0A9N9XNL5_PHYSR|nr:unnamed protein product [Phyllotreta striolata]